MVTFSMIKLGADILLVFAVGYLGLKIRKNGNLSGKSSDLLILEASLKGLIKDSESASRHLNDELQRRQNSLERLLADLDNSEKRINQINTSLAEVRPQLDLKIQEGRDLLVSLTKASSETSIKLQSRAQHIEPQAAEKAPEPPSFETVVPTKEVAKHKLPSRAKNSELQEPLARKIEREVMPGRLSNESETKDRLEKVYNAVEAMVRAGHDLKTIARITKMPEERVKVLAAMIEDRDQDKGDDKDKGKDEGKEFSVDPRLGVLGGMKRQVETL